jgi:hypothetical protein
MLERVEAVQVADEDLNRRNERGHPHRHGEHLARMFLLRILEQMPRANGSDDQRRREICGDHRMDEAIRKTRIEDDGEPAVRGHELPLAVQRESGRRLHPAVHRQDPERGDERADGDHERRREVQPLSDLLHAEQHDAQEPRFEEERGQHFVGHERTDHGTRAIREHGPVRAELVGHHDAGDHAHREGDREDLDPVLVEI